MRLSLVLTFWFWGYPALDATGRASLGRIWCFLRDLGFPWRTRGAWGSEQGKAHNKVFGKADGMMRKKALRPPLNNITASTSPKLGSKHPQSEAENVLHRVGHPRSGFHAGCGRFPSLPSQLKHPSRKRKVSQGGLTCHQELTTTITRM